MPEAVVRGDHIHVHEITGEATIETCLVRWRAKIPCDLAGLLFEVKIKPFSKTEKPVPVSIWPSPEVRETFLSILQEHKDQQLAGLQPGQVTTRYETLFAQAKYSYPAQVVS